MMDRWIRETELQRVYGLGTLEARYTVLSEDGLDRGEIAGMNGVSVNTVRNMVHRAGIKMREREGGRTRLVIPYGHELKDFERARENAMRVVLGVVTEALGTELREGRHVMYMDLPTESGDTAWLLDNVFRYVDPYGTITGPERDRRVRLIVEKAEAASPEWADRVGLGVVMYYLDRMGVPHDLFDIDGPAPTPAEAKPKGRRRVRTTEAVE